MSDYELLIFVMGYFVGMVAFATILYKGYTYDWHGISEVEVCIVATFFWPLSLVIWIVIGVTAMICDWIAE